MKYDPVYVAAMTVVDNACDGHADDKTCVDSKHIEALRVALGAERPPITHVACIDTEGRVWSLPRPFRHDAILRLMYEHGTRCAEDNHYSQGFLDASGRYLHRKAAIASAELNNQLKDGKIRGGGILTSEDVW